MSRTNPSRRPVEKILGEDREYGIFTLGPPDAKRLLTQDQATRRVLAEVGGVISPRSTGAAATRAVADSYSGYSGYGAASDYSVDDYARHYLANGGCIYGDMAHPEACTPETTSAFAAAAYSRANAAILARALAAANAATPPGQRIVLTANNADVTDTTSWGGHLNVALAAWFYDELMNCRQKPLLQLMAFQTSAIAFTGAGKVLPAPRQSGQLPFAFTQRGSHTMCLISTRTTWMRPIVNRRREPHTGPDSDVERAHVIFFDSLLGDYASVLTRGSLQLFLAALECGEPFADILLEDPLAALYAFDNDISLKATADTMSGAMLTALDIQERILGTVAAFVHRGDAEQYVPDAATILGLWTDAVDHLRRGDIEWLSRRLEWCVKLRVLTEAMDRHHLSWDDVAELKHLEWLFSAIDENGLLLACEDAGMVERLVDPAAVRRATVAPPEDTRAYLRGRLLDRPDAHDTVDSVDWSKIVYTIGHWPSTRRFILHLNELRVGTRAAVEDLFDDPGKPLAQLLAELGAEEIVKPARRGTATPVVWVPADKRHYSI